MNLLFLTPQLPFPARQGTAIRNFGLIEQLARRHTIDLITFLAPGETLAADNPLHTLCRQLAVVAQPTRASVTRIRDTFLNAQPDMALRLASHTMTEQVRAWAAENPYDIIQAEGIEMIAFGMQARAAAPASKLVFDNHNCEYLLQKRNALTDLRLPRRLPAALYSLVQWRKLVRYERNACLQSDAVLAVSAPDAAALRALDPTIRVDVALNGINAADIPHLPPHEPPPPVLVFTGKMDYRPNIDAALWFGAEVLPLIRASLPAVRFQIVGQAPHARLDALRADPAVEITGAVTDVRPYIAGAGVYVMPLRVGGGTRFKALEAMASGKPIVSTTLGVEGLGAEDGRQMLIADDAPSFAHAVLKLLDPAQSALRASLGSNARTLVERKYGWENIVEDVERVYARITT